MRKIPRPKASSLRASRQPGPKRRIPDPPHALLLRSLSRRWTTFLGELRTVRAAGSQPEVHDLRVAIRRLVAAIDLASAISPSKQLATVRRQLKGLLKRLGLLRDAEVQLLSLRELMQGSPELGAIATVLLLRKRRDLRRVVRRLERLQTRQMQQVVLKASGDIRASEAKPPVRSASRTLLEASLAEAFLRLVHRRQALDGADPATIHRLRISFKKFRYTTEILRPDAEKALHDVMDAFQTQMGEIRDLEVLMRSIADFKVRRRLPPSPPAPGRVVSPDGLEKVQRRLRRRHGVLVRRFMRSVDRLYLFYGQDDRTASNT